MITCNICKFEYDDESRTACVHCGLPANFPNVRTASRPKETSVIDNEYDDIINKVPSVIGAVLKAFEATVRNESQTVLVRPLAEVVNLFDRLNNFHQTFHQRLRTGAVGFDGGKYDENRPSVDGKLFPRYHEEITFAALSIREAGVSGPYGKCHMVLKTPLTQHRASVFNGNSYEVLENLGAEAAKPVPNGLRTTWERRGKMAVSKFARKFTATTTDTEFPALLNDGNNDFIEVHVFGSISHHTIEKVGVNKAALDAYERLLASALKMKIAKWASTVPKWDTVFLEI